MKHVVILIDGMADEAVPVLNNRTPLEAANIQAIDNLAPYSELGMVQTIPAGMPPGSDVANLSIMGYAPEVYHTGRSPLEAVNIGITLEPEDIVFRLNLVTVSEVEDNYLDRKMVDHSAGDITSEEARLLLLTLKDELEVEGIAFHAGTSYRNIVVWDKGHTELTLVPPHDILEQSVKRYMPKGEQWIYDMTEKSYDILKDHPVNKARKEKGLNPANSIWIWGEGRKPNLTQFSELYGIKGSTISAVDLIKGIGLCAGLNAIEVEGATGTIDTNFKGKADACINALNHGKDFVYLHLEATDECSHQGNLEAKIKAVEIIDQEVVSYLKEQLDHLNMDYKFLVLPDHPTPVHLRTHTSDPVPYMLYDSRNKKRLHERHYHEKSCAKGEYFASGPELLKYFLK